MKQIAASGPLAFLFLYFWLLLVTSSVVLLTQVRGKPTEVPPPTPARRRIPRVPSQLQTAKVPEVKELVPSNLREILDKKIKDLETRSGRSEGLQSPWQNKQRGPDAGAQVIAGNFVTGGKGEINRNEVQLVVEYLVPKIQTCYQGLLLDNPTIKGKLLIRWNISPRGEVNSVLVEKSQVENPELHSCVTQTISQARFPKPKEGSVQVRWPLLFSGQ